MPQIIPAAFGPPVVAYMALSRISDQAKLAQRAEKMSAEELLEFEKAHMQLMDRATKLPAYPGWKDKVQVGDDLEASGCGHVYALADLHAACVIVVGLRKQQYPERVARELQQEVLAKVRMNITEKRLSEAQPGDLTAELKALFKEAAKNYGNPAKVDQVTHVYQKVEQVKGLMQDNVKNILETHVTMETLQGKSHSMSASADKFLKQSVAVKQQAQKRRVRVKVAVGAGACLLLGLVALLSSTT